MIHRARHQMRFAATACLESVIIRIALIGGLGLMALQLLNTAPILALILIGLAGIATTRPMRAPRMPAMDDAERVADQILHRAHRSHRTAAAMAIAVDDFAPLRKDLGAAASARLMTRLTGRLLHEFPQDQFFVNHLSGQILMLPSPKRRLDTKSTLSLAEAVQSSLSQPIPMGNLSHTINTSIGYCLSSRDDIQSGAQLVTGATRALHAAQRGTSGGICGDSKQLRHRVETGDQLMQQIPHALRSGQIRAYFQPQISTRTGAITGFEALARWQHPTRGLIPPSEFLPLLESSGHIANLGIRIVEGALDALLDWRRAGFDIPGIAVNFSQVELERPDLVARLNAALTQRNLPPDCLSIEVLETVVAQSDDDLVIGNLAALAQMGCRIDLDDFGTGHASITTIRKFSAERIKIDRSFVTGLDSDPEQRAMVSAILLMADRLGLETLAEGVETDSERAALTQMGCGHLQGFAIGRPMTHEGATAWIESYLEKLGQPPARSIRNTA